MYAREISETADRFSDKLLEKDVGKQRVTKEDAVSTRERLRPTTQMDTLSEVDFVIEAVPVRYFHSLLHR